MKNYCYKKILFLVCISGFLNICFLKNNIYAQTKISGLLKTQNPTQAEGAIINLLYKKDSTVAKTSFSEKNGKFEMENVKMGEYFLYISHAGYKDYTSKPINIQSNDAIELPEIILTENETELEAVTITAQKSFVEKKIDRIVVNPDALLTNAGLNTMEILEKAPMVRIDENGVISLRGKQGVVVFVDDKPTYLSAKDLEGFLKGIPSANIESIEIMTTPPAKYDAAGNAGIINIKMKRLNLKGYNGNINLSAGQGFYGRTNNSFNLNYRVDKVNFFVGGGANINRRYQDLTITRNYFDNQNNLTTNFIQNTFIKREQQNYTLRFGMDYYATKNATFGILVNGFYNPAFNVNNAKAQVSDANMTPQTFVNGLTPNDGQAQNGTINLNYNQKIGSLGKNLSVNLDYLVYDLNTIQSLTNDTYNQNRVLLNQTVLSSKLPSNIDIKTAKIDYENPLKNNAKLEIGFKTSLVSTTNNANFFDVVNNVSNTNNEFSNSFKYDENINAGYINFNKNFGKFALQTGLRIENTNLKGYQYGNPTKQDSTFMRDYTNLFPTIFLQYTSDSLQTNQYVFSYGRRVNRPDYQSMNPFLYPLDKFTLYGGNPFLQPTFAHNFEVSHTYKGQFTTTFQTSFENNNIGETMQQVGTIFYSRPNNYGSFYNYGVSFNANLEPTKWLTVQLYAELMNNNFNANLYNQNINLSLTHISIAPTLQFKLGKDWSSEINASYTSSALAGQFIVIPVGLVNMALSKRILKNKGAIKVNLSDVFYTNQRGGEITNLQNSTAGWHSFFDSRVLALAFSWRFESGKHLKIRQSSGADSEKNRVKT